MSRTATAALAVLALATPALAVDALAYSGPAWSPYLAGALIGVLVCVMLAAANRPLGASSAYAHAAGLLGRGIAPRRTERLRYFRENPPEIGWSLLLLAGTVVGGFLAAWHGGELTGRYLPPFWTDRFGDDSAGLRTVFAAGGGMLLALGARLAGGCTSGHGISGALQLSLGSWIALVAFFVGGAGTAFLVYGS